MKRRVYNPELPSYGCYALADFYGEFPPSDLEVDVQVEIYNDTHPVSFRLPNIVWDKYFGGSCIIHQGQNVQIIARFINTNTCMDNSTSWLSANFGNGRVVAFSPHPEIQGYYKSNRSHLGKTVISNAFYYTTSKELTELEIYQFRLQSFISHVIQETIKIVIGSGETVDIFNENKNKINESIDELKYLTEDFKILLNLIEEIAIEKNVEIKKDNKAYLGWKSVKNPIVFYLDTFLNYFDNTLETLTTFEKIYPLIENDTQVVQKIDTLKTDLFNRINEIHGIFKKCRILCEKYENELIFYQNCNFPCLAKFLEVHLMDKGHKLYWQIFSVFSYIPQVYFNSLKLLRNIWYNYEASIIEI
jgi:hypothetical protein